MDQRVAGDASSMVGVPLAGTLDGVVGPNVRFALLSMVCANYKPKACGNKSAIVNSCAAPSI